MSITILELYPRHLAINGDMGNTVVLAERARLAALQVTVSQYNPGDDIPSDIDIVVIGSGPASALRAIAKDVERIAPRARQWVQNGAALLAVGAGFQLAGRTVSGISDSPVSGLGIFDMTTDAAAPRVVTEDFVIDSPFGRLVGIENHGSVSALNEGQAPFASVVTGRGNGDAAHPGHEGALTSDAIGTHMHGPILAMNPVVADHLLSVAAKRHSRDYVPGPEHARLDELALATRVLLDPISANGPSRSQTGTRP